MENVSKALLISAGILFAILTLSLVVILYNNIQTIETANDDAIAMEQLTAFNAEYEAFNKQLLYGTEVITAVNKAIENNLKAQDDENNDWYINVVVTTNNESFKTTGWKTKKGVASPTKEELSQEDINELSLSHPGWGISNTTITIKQKVSLFKEHKLFTSYGNLRMNSGVISFFSGNTNDLKQEDDDYTYEIYSALKNFKSRIFKCTGISYKEGRVCEITFEIQPQ